ncbi:MAG: nickel pincer cofactor biosynthesis protein LarC [Methanospirillum sp.]|nr:nickel pincer cofactor biosynthesis protein LarC [Methanospirillum sp.]
MRILVIDPVSGAAGDMLVGGLLAAGGDREAVRRSMASVVADPEFGYADRAGIRGVRVLTRAGPSRRTLEEVLVRVSGADAPGEAIALAVRVFRRLAAAEASVHGDDQVHFHEVGADDAIADVLGAATALLSLGVDGIAVMPVPLGPGTTDAAHGAYPLPAPATVALLAGTGMEVRFVPDADGELVTPTGAALLAEFVTTSWRQLAPFTILSAGYGAGSRDPPGRPNVLRALVVETAHTHGDYVEVLETNVDDVTGEVMGNALARVMEEGALDAQAIPALMKKGRMGYLVRVVCPPADGPALARILAEELGTLGVRSVPFVHRLVAERSIEPIEVTIGSETRLIDVKRGRIAGRTFTSKPEFEQLRAWAEETGLPLREVARAVERAISLRSRGGGTDEH